MEINEWISTLVIGVRTMCSWLPNIICINFWVFFLIFDPSLLLRSHLVEHSRFLMSGINFFNNLTSLIAIANWIQFSLWMLAFEVGRPLQFSRDDNWSIGKNFIDRVLFHFLWIWWNDDKCNECLSFSYRTINSQWSLATMEMLD